MKVLIGGFRGSTNSARLLVDRIVSKNSLEKVYFVNSFETSKNQLEYLLQKQKYDLIIMFGQKPEVSSVYLECQACMNGTKLITNHAYDRLAKMLTKSGFTVKVSNNAGNYLCNHIYFIGLKYVQYNNLNTKMMFIHTPSINNIENIDDLAHLFSVYINEFIEGTEHN